MTPTVAELRTTLEQKLAAIRRDDARARRRELLGRDIDTNEEDAPWEE